MRFTLRFNGVDQGVNLHELETILSTAIGPLAHRVKQVFLYIEDVNGPRGGVDKQCRCVLHLRRLRPIVIRDRDENVHALVHRVGDRVVEALRRKKDRITSRTTPPFDEVEI